MRLKKFPTSFYISISIGFAQISGEDVIAKMMKNPSQSDIKMNFKMTLSSNSKEKKSKKHFRLMEQIEKRYQDGEFKSKLLLRFIEPKEVRGLSLLNWSRIDQKNDDQWLYIPKLRKVKRIRPAEKSRKFQGTEFTYADFINRDIKLDKYTLLGEDDFKGNQCFLVTKKACKILFENLNKPIQPSDSDMSERVVRKGLLKCYISNERLGYQIDGDDSNTIPKGSKKFYYDKEKK